MDWAGFY